MNYVKIQHDKLDVGVINELVVDESCGAVSMFIGTTRDNLENKKVLYLEYESYESMALKIINKICEDLRCKWPDLKHIAIYHRLGMVPVKEASVIIAISSPHRLSSLQSVQYAIDELKKSVPIWKKEKYENDTKNYENNWTKRIKRSNLNFDKCSIDLFPIPKSLIQISAHEYELSRRIQCFLEKKREEINLNNVFDFTMKAPINENESQNKNSEEESCARINSILIRQNDSKEYLKVYRVKNEFGPEMISDYKIVLDKLITNQSKQNIIKSEEEKNYDVKPISVGVVERLENAEKYLNLPLPVSKDVYQRLKIIEDKIQFLETITPEYRHFIQYSGKLKKEDHICKKTYTSHELDNYITILKNKLNNNE